MYKHILVPTDGSKLSRKAVKAAARLAKVVGAKLTGAYVTTPYTPAMYGEAAVYVPAMSPVRFKEMAEKEANNALAMVEAEARAAGIKWATASTTNSQPWQGIIKLAGAKKCDLIVMASHGRSGLSGLLLGSETIKVLTHSKIPVLVYR